MAFPLPEPRPCGGCTACCTALYVEELAKQAGLPCSCLRGDGCGIWEERPRICRGFFCNWALGDPSLPEEARPDRSGLLAWAECGAAGLILQVRELRPGALQAEEARRLVERARAVVPVALEAADGRRRFGMPGQDWIEIPV